MFRALRVTDGTPRLTTDATDDQLGDGDVTIDVEFSSINYKDGMALGGVGGVLRGDHVIPGIDLVGTVSASDSPDVAVGDRVLVNGCGLGESHSGGLAEKARVPADWLVPVPDAFTSSQAAAIGTAGYTAMLAVLELERGGVEGDVIVTGASGGVGSVAVALLSALGFRVTASTGRAEESDWLRSLGADEILDRASLSEPGRPLQSQRWSGAVDSVGGPTLANVIAQLRYGGTAAACGLAASPELTTALVPFLLRATRLIGINSVNTPRPLRLEAWQRLGRDLDPAVLDSLSETIGLEQAIERAGAILDGGVRGRTVVDVRA